jgi:uncharacterized membrane protein YgcG
MREVQRRSNSGARSGCGAGAWEPVQLTNAWKDAFLQQTAVNVKDTSGGQHSRSGKSCGGGGGGGGGGGAFGAVEAHEVTNIRRRGTAQRLLKYYSNL